MNIKMLNDRFDNDIKIWSKDDIFNVQNNKLNYYIIKIINGQKYCILKSMIGKEYIVL